MDLVSFTLGLLHVILWIGLIGGLFLLTYDKKYRQVASSIISTGIVGLCAWPFISTFFKGPVPNKSVEDNLSMLAAKSPFYSILILLPNWVLVGLVLLVIILGFILVNYKKQPKS